MSIVSRAAHKTLDGKDCFYKWLELGSIIKVRNHYANLGMVSPRTKRPFVYSGILAAAYKFVIENHEEVRPIYLGEGSEVAKVDQAWEEWLVHKAIKVYLIISSKGRFLGWIERNNFEKYDYMYADEYFNEEPKYTRKPMDKIYHEIGTQGGYRT